MLISLCLFILSHVLCATRNQYFNKFTFSREILNLHQPENLANGVSAGLNLQTGKDKAGEQSGSDKVVEQNFQSVKTAKQYANQIDVEQSGRDKAGEQFTHQLDVEQSGRDKPVEESGSDKPVVSQFAAKRVSFILNPSRDISHSQSIGYTLESYPNPLNSPDLCTHQSLSPHLCDPDSLLTASDQAKLISFINQSQLNCKLYVALAINIFYAKEDENPQLAFARQLLSSWGEFRDGCANCVLLLYVKDLDKLEIALGDGIDKRLLNEDAIIAIKDQFDREKRFLLPALETSIELIKTYERNVRGYIGLIFGILILAATGILITHTIYN